MVSTLAVTDDYIKLGQLYKFLYNTGLFLKKSDLKTIINQILDINYKLPHNSLIVQNKIEYSGNTALHFISEYFSFVINEKCFEILLKCGADFIITNDKGYSPLLLAFYNGNIVKPLLRAHVETNNSTNIHCNNGISHFHVACSTDLVEVVNFFLKAGVPVNEQVKNDSPRYPGYTPLHFAAKHRHLQTIELLLSNGADLGSKDVKGRTPLHLIMSQLVQIKDLENDLKINEFLIKSARIKLFNQLDDIDLLHSYLKCYLYKKNSNNELLTQEVLTGSPIRFDLILGIGSNFNLNFIKSLLLQGANILDKVANGITVFDLCLKKCDLNDIIDILKIEKRHQLSQLKFIDGNCLLDFLEAMRTPDSFKQFIINNVSNASTFIPFESLIWPGYNFLHFGVLFDCCIPELFSGNDNFITLNKDGMSPLHLAFRMNRKKAVAQILEAHKQISANPVNKNNLSHLHIACAAGHTEVAKLLLINGANPNLPTLCNYYYYYCDGSSFERLITAGSTSLHIAVQATQFDLAEMLLYFKANPHAADAEGLTPFQKTLNDSYTERSTLESILIKMLETDLKTWIVGATGIQTLREVLSHNEQRFFNIVKRLVKEFDKRKAYKKLGLTRLQVACYIGNLTMVQKEIESKVNINQRISFDSDLWPGDSALHILFRENPKQTNKIAKLLLAHGADFTLKNASNLTPIHLCKYTTLQRAIRFLGRNFTRANPVNNDGLSHFHLCCKTKYAYLVKDFFKLGANINTSVDYFAEDFAGWTPLHFAVSYNNKEVVELLLKYGADHKITNSRGFTPLHQAVSSNSNENVVESLIRFPTVNLQDTSLFGDTALMIALNISLTYNENIVNLLINKGAHVSLKWLSVDNEKELHRIFITAKKYSSEIFSRLIPIIPALTAIDDMDQNPFFHLCFRGFLDTDFYSYKCNVNFLIEIGFKLNHKNSKGETALHVATLEDDCGTAHTLLLLGADLSMKNDNGETPYDLAVKDDSSRIKKLFAEHIQMLKEVGLNVKESYELLHNKRNIDTKLDDVRVEKNELSIMFKNEIEFISVEYFFTEEFIVKYRRMQATHREAICDFFESYNFYYKLSNLYPAINLQFRKVRTRTRLYEPAKVAFYAFAGLILPDLCLDLIFNHLSNEDMMNLVRAKNKKLIFSPISNYY